MPASEKLWKLASVPTVWFFFSHGFISCSSLMHQGGSRCTEGDAEGVAEVTNIVR